MDRAPRIIKWGWYPVLITALAVAGLIYRWPIEYVVPALVILLGIGLVVALISSREKQLEISVLRLRQVADYFHRRFMGNSPLSIFAIIDTLFAVEDSKLWDWARACDMSQRIFNTWCSSFINRMESDFGNRKLAVYACNYLNELWSMTSHYHEFIDQFYEIAQTMELPRETLDRYQQFGVEYNTFVQDFRDNIGELRKSARTSIDPPSVKLARELKVAK